MYGTYIGDDKMLINLVYNGMLIVSSKDLSLMPSLVTKGHIEMPLTKFFIDYLKPGFLVLDVGANVGYFTLLAAKLVGEAGKVISYEANPSVFNILEDNISMNWINQQVLLINKGVYSHSTFIDFYSSRKYQGDSSIFQRPQTENIHDNYNIIKIETVTLDEQLKDIDHIDLIKIDIEGGEYRAFLGMKNILENKKAKVISFEWNKNMLGSEATELYKLLSQLIHEQGYQLHVLDSEGQMQSIQLQQLLVTDFYPYAILTS